MTFEVSNKVKVTISYRKILAARMIVNYFTDKNTLPFLTLIPEISRLLFLPTINNRVDYDKIDFKYLVSRVHPTRLEPDLFQQLFRFVYDENTSDRLSNLHSFFRYLTKENQLALADAINEVYYYYERNN